MVQLVRCPPSAALPSSAVRLQHYTPQQLRTCCTPPVLPAAPAACPGTAPSARQTGRSAAARAPPPSPSWQPPAHNTSNITLLSQPWTLLQTGKLYL
jgi:hypothetical protein